MCPLCISTISAVFNFNSLFHDLSRFSLSLMTKKRRIEREREREHHLLQRMWQSRRCSVNSLLTDIHFQPIRHLEPRVSARRDSRGDRDGSQKQKWRSSFSKKSQLKPRRDMVWPLTSPNTKCAKSHLKHPRDVDWQFCSPPSVIDV